MEWLGEGILIAARRYGEADALAEVFCRERGLIKGFVKGGMGKRQRAVLQPGNHVSYTWRARLETNLGRFTFDLVKSPLGYIIDDGPRLAAFQAVLASAQSALLERAEEPDLFDAFVATLDLIATEASTPTLWAAALAKLELMLLKAAGFGLDLESCAATGSTQSLVYVSPKSGRAVSKEAGDPYQSKLLALPRFLHLPGLEDPTIDDATAALALSGYFLTREIWNLKSGAMPEARSRFLASLER